MDLEAIKGRLGSFFVCKFADHKIYTHVIVSARVSKNEERFDVENKTMANILSQAKQIELQLMSKQEQLASRDGQNTLYFHRLQEEVDLFEILK